jgi:cytochrome oxidase Cu insertion factor (SCO1/SenC/PrrC family)
MRRPDNTKLALIVFVIFLAGVLMAATVWGVRTLAASQYQATVQPNDIALGGFPVNGDLAPDFTLVDQFGQSVTLSSLRGREVVLAFIDARCTSLCPLTAQIMYAAKARLGSSTASKVMLVAVNANTTATSVSAVQAWSIQHGMLHQWLFLTGTAQQLEAIYRSYKVYEQVNADGSVTHDPITYIIDASGHERLYFETLDSKSQSDLSSQEIGLADGMKQWLPQS